LQTNIFRPYSTQSYGFSTVHLVVMVTSRITSPPVISFKNKLDKHWHNWELMYYWQTEMTVTGSNLQCETGTSIEILLVTSLLQCWDLENTESVCVKYRILLF